MLIDDINKQLSIPELNDAIEVLGHPNVITFDNNWNHICKTAVDAMHIIKSIMKGELNG